MAPDPEGGTFHISETALMWVAIAVIAALILVQGWAILHLYSRLPAVPGETPPPPMENDWDPSESAQ